MFNWLNCYLSQVYVIVIYFHNFLPFFPFAYFFLFVPSSIHLFFVVGECRQARNQKYCRFWRVPTSKYWKINFCFDSSLCQQEFFRHGSHRPNASMTCSASQCLRSMVSFWTNLILKLWFCLWWCGVLCVQDMSVVGIMTYFLKVLFCEYA